MKTFTYTIKDELGIHARPAGQLTKLAKTYASEILIEKDGKSVNATKLMAIMGMGIKCGDTVQIIVEGEDEETACEGMKGFFEETL